MLRNIIKVFVSNFWVVILGFINGFIFPKIMSINEYAVYQEYNMYLTYIGILHIGLPTGMFINYGGCNYNIIDKKQYKSEIRLLLMIISFFTGVGLLACYIFYNPILFFLSLSVIPYCYLASYQSLYQAWSRFRTYSFINALIPTAFCLCSLLVYGITGQIKGNERIIIFIVIYYIACFFIFVEYLRFTKGHKANRVFSNKNRETIKVGFLVSLGNFVFGLFGSIDRQFVRIYFDNNDFAMYSFAISIQTLINVLISAISNPFYLHLADKKLLKSDYNDLKEALLMIGAFASSAYFVCSFIVINYLKDFNASLKIIGILFAVFPAYTVVICLYVNLYKLTKQTKKYMSCIVMMLLIVIGFDFIAIHSMKDFSSVSYAALVTYYLWMFYSSRDFTTVSINMRDVIYLILFLSTFFTVSSSLNSVLGFGVYILLISMISMVVYWKTINKLIKLLKIYD